MKKLMIAAILSLLFLVSTSSAKAYEGNVELKSSSATCKATSVWRENDYKLIGRCDGLVYPYQTQYEHYVVWAHVVERDTTTRIGEIERGYFEGNIKDSFDRIFITAETGGSPRRPSNKVVLEGNVVRFVFDKSEVEVQETVAVTETEEVNDVAVDVGTSNAGRVIGKIVTALLTIILVVVGLVVISSLVFRRRGSISG